MGSIHRQCLAKRIAIIGAGPCGVAAAKYFSSERFFDSIVVFEQRNQPGGIWHYTEQTSGDGLFNVPQSDPHVALELPIWENAPGCTEPDNSNKEATFLSPIYERLETNIPKPLMGYSDMPFDADLQLFPRHEEVQRYLEKYAKDVVPMIKFQSQVEDVRFTGTGENAHQDEWLVTSLDLSSGQRMTDAFNAVVVATGHYSTPYIPDIAGVAEWNHLFPGSVSHSKYYRAPEPFSGKKVVVLGGSASGLDISSQIATVCKTPLLLSQKSVSYLAAGFADNQHIESVAQIKSVNPTNKTITFFDGREESNVDLILFCTGYLYTMPFLKSLQPNPVGDGTRIEHTHQHLFYAPHPSLAFLALPQKVIPFPLSVAQSAVLARVYSGRLELPPESEMEQWEQEVIAERGDRGEFHTLKFPKDAEYINMLYDWAISASKRDGLENGGVGKLPNRWGSWEYWARENFPAIRKAFVQRGEARKEVKSLKDLGFDYPQKPEDSEAVRKDDQVLKQADVNGAL